MSRVMADAPLGQHNLTEERAISVHPTFKKRVLYEYINLNMVDTHDMERLGQIYLLICKWPVCVLSYSQLP